MWCAYVCILHIRQYLFTDESTAVCAVLLRGLSADARLSHQLTLISICVPLGGRAAELLHRIINTMYLDTVHPQQTAQWSRREVLCDL
ncbi:MAG: hypothetical protein ACI8UP_002785 [Porticoccaceae bacterium]|jgi:hypothetical protein